MYNKYYLEDLYNNIVNNIINKEYEAQKNYLEEEYWGFNFREDVGQIEEEALFNINIEYNNYYNSFRSEVIYKESYIYCYETIEEFLKIKELKEDEINIINNLFKDGVYLFLYCKGGTFYNRNREFTTEEKELIIKVEDFINEYLKEIEERIDNLIVEYEEFLESEEFKNEVIELIKNDIDDTEYTKEELIKFILDLE